MKQRNMRYYRIHDDRNKALEDFKEQCIHFESTDNLQLKSRTELRLITKSGFEISYRWMRVWNQDTSMFAGADIDHADLFGVFKSEDVDYICSRIRKIYLPEYENVSTQYDPFLKDIVNKIYA